MIFSTIEKVLFGAFFGTAFVASPEQDYDTQSLYLGLGLASYSRTIDLLLVSAAALWMVYRGIACLRAGKTSTACGRLAVAAAVAIVFVRFPGATDCVALATIVATFLVPVAVFLGVPVWAATRAVQCAAIRDGASSLQYAAIPLLGLCLFFAGRGISDAVAVRLVAPRISPAMSGIAAYGLGGPLFLAKYVVYDGSSDQRVDELHRIATFLDRGSCDVRARQIGSHYYIATEAC